ncbi:hypothetical protein [Leucobacter sp.]
MNAEPPPHGPRDGSPENRPELIGGFTFDELSEYVDGGRDPRRPEIEQNAETRHAVAQLERIRALGGELLVAGTEPELDESWFQGVLSRLSREVRAGRDVPISSADESTRLTVSEGALRALIRDTTDALGDAVVGRTRFDGDLTAPGAPIVVHVEVAAYADTRLPDLADRVRGAVWDALQTHTELEVTDIDIAITDVLLRRRDGGS